MVSRPPSTGLSRVLEAEGGSKWRAAECQDSWGHYCLAAGFTGTVTSFTHLLEGPEQDPDPLQHILGAGKARKRGQPWHGRGASPHNRPAEREMG